MDLTHQQLLRCTPACPPAKVEEFLPHLNAAMREFGIDTPARVAAFLAQLAHESGDLRWMEELPHRHITPGCQACENADLGDYPLLGETLIHEAGVQYEGRRDLSNTQPGDGARFKGRGVIQLTGRANYREASLALFPGQGRVSALPTVRRETYLELNPSRAASPDVTFRVAGWFWATKRWRHEATDSTSVNASVQRRARRAAFNELADAAVAAFADASAGTSREWFDVITRGINGGLSGANDRWRRYLRCCEALVVVSASVSPAA